MVCTYGGVWRPRCIPSDINRTTCKRGAALDTEVSTSTCTLLPQCPVLEQSAGQVLSTDADRGRSLSLFPADFESWQHSESVHCWQSDDSACLSLSSGETFSLTRTDEKRKLMIGLNSKGSSDYPAELGARTPNYCSQIALNLSFERGELPIYAAPSHPP